MNPITELHLLLDQGVPRDAAALLRKLGCECTHVGEIGMARSEDREILDFATHRGWAIVTLDADFHVLLAVSGADGPSVIRLRMQGLNATKVALLVQVTVKRFSHELAAGSMITVKPRKTTCHRLPVGGH